MRAGQNVMDPRSSRMWSTFAAVTFTIAQLSCGSTENSRLKITAFENASVKY